MPDVKKIIDNPDTSSPRRADRELELAEWNEEEARNTAQQEGIEMSDAHWQVVHRLRQHYLDHGLPQSGREIGDMLDEAFSAAGGRRYLRKLFPEGPVRQGMRIAGLPVPPHTEDEGFGTSR